MPDTTTPAPELDPCMLRRLSNGDYIRVQIQRSGDLALLQLGNAEGEQYVWRWEMWLAPQDISWLLQGLAYTHAQIDAHINARHGQMAERLRSYDAAK